MESIQTAERFSLLGKGNCLARRHRQLASPAPLYNHTKSNCCLCLLVSLSLLLLLPTVARLEVKLISQKPITQNDFGAKMLSNDTQYTSRSSREENEVGVGVGVALSPADFTPVRS